MCEFSHPLTVKVSLKQNTTPPTAINQGHGDGAIAAGGTDNGPPGVRAHYHPNYYGAFVRDRDGHNIEAVCHAPA